GSGDPAAAARAREARGPPPAPAETTDRRLAGLVYAASLRAVDPARPAARAYLDRLARNLHLSPEETAAIRRRLSQAP
ncbi:MAG: DUF533 domain-containing protein, partial [Rhodospirillaceae bacterium]|nr:DUF533 domain-containing protein [Rhodospirillaceae bacterium]